MTTNEAKKLATAELSEAGVEYAKLSAKTWDFSDLARGSIVKVSVHGVVWTDAAREYFANRPKGRGFIVAAS